LLSNNLDFQNNRLKFFFCIEKFYSTNEKVALFASDEEILSEAKRNLNSLIIDSQKTSKELTDKIVSITKNCLMVSEKIGIFCVKIRETLEAEIVGLWGCNTFYDNIPNTSIAYLSSFSVIIHFGRLSTNVFKI
jgi:hypothetical protein